MKLTKIIFFVICFLCCLVTIGIGEDLLNESHSNNDGPKISQGKLNPGSEVVKVERVKVPDPSKGYEDLGQPKQSDATRVTTSDGKQITVTDDGRRFK